MSRIVKKIKRPLIVDLKSDDPKPWWSTSDRLMKAARMLWPALNKAVLGPGALGSVERADTDLFAGFFLLAGFAVENALKARILANRQAAGNPAPLAKRSAVEYFGTSSQLHDLVQLAVTANVSLGTGERKLLERLQQFTLWGARYPMPKKLGPGQATFRRDTRDRDLREIETFLERLKA
jgi:hypothetical protein